MKKLKAELEQTCKLDVIEKFDEPTDWVSSMVILEKGNGQLRICLDPRDLNSAIKHHHYPLLMRFFPTTFLSHMITSEGMKPDPKKIEARTNMPTPSNKMEVQQFLGMVTYLGKFLPNLSEETAPLRQLLQKDIDCHPHGSNHNMIQKLKHLVMSSPILTYEPNHALRITADASKSGLGAVLEQCHEDAWKPIASASRVMTQSEQN